VIAVALKKCGKSNQSEAWWWYNRAVKNEYFRHLEKLI